MSYRNTVSRCQSPTPRKIGYFLRVAQSNSGYVPNRATPRLGTAPRSQVQRLRSPAQTRVKYPTWPTVRSQLRRSQAGLAPPDLTAHHRERQQTAEERDRRRPGSPRRTSRPITESGSRQQKNAIVRPTRPLPPPQASCSSPPGLSIKCRRPINTSRAPVRRTVCRAIFRDPASFTL